MTVLEVICSQLTAKAVAKQLSEKYNFLIFGLDKIENGAYLSYDDDKYWFDGMALLNHKFNAPKNIGQQEITANDIAGMRKLIRSELEIPSVSDITVVNAVISHKIAEKPAWADSLWFNKTMRNIIAFKDMVV